MDRITSLPERLLAYKERLHHGVTHHYTLNTLNYPYGDCKELNENLRYKYLEMRDSLKQWAG